MRFCLRAALALLPACTPTAAPETPGQTSCDASGYEYIDFEELRVNAPRYERQRIAVDGIAEAGPRQCPAADPCQCTADLRLVDALGAPEGFTLVFSEGHDVGCKSDAKCELQCGPANGSRVRILGTATAGVEPFLKVDRQCPLGG